MAKAVLPGTRWISKRGHHRGSEIEITNVSDVSVTYKTLNRVASGPLDDARLNRLTREQFGALYVPSDSLMTADTRGGKAFRQNNAVKLRRLDSLEDDEPKAAPQGLPAAPPKPAAQNGHVTVNTGTTGLAVEVMEITPLTAKSWLEQNGTNRRLSKRRVEKLVASIRRGEWRMTGESIKFDTNGKLADGQHRLEAIIAANAPITTVVMRNVPVESFDVIDTGKVRTAGDVLSMHGFHTVYATAAAARGLMLIDKYGRYNVGNREAEDLTSNAAILEYVRTHPDVTEAVHHADILKNMGFLGGTGLLAILCAMLLRTDKKAAELFIEQLGSGANLDANSPILRFRNRMLNQSLYRRAAPEREETLAIGIKVWNAWRAGEEMRALVWRGYAERNAEEFPKPI